MLGDYIGWTGKVSKMLHLDVENTLLLTLTEMSNFVTLFLRQLTYYLQNMYIFITIALHRRKHWSNHDDTATKTYDELTNEVNVLSMHSRSEINFDNGNENKMQLLLYSKINNNRRCGCCRQLWLLKGHRKLLKRRRPTTKMPSSATTMPWTPGAPRLELLSRLSRLDYLKMTIKHMFASELEGTDTWSSYFSTSLLVSLDNFQVLWSNLCFDT